MNQGGCVLYSTYNQSSSAFHGDYGDNWVVGYWNPKKSWILTSLPKSDDEVFSYKRR